MKKLETIQLLLVCVGILFACKGSAGTTNASVGVDCVGNSKTIDCAVTHKKGTSRVKACWELHFHVCEWPESHRLGVPERRPRPARGQADPHHEPAELQGM